MGLILTPKTVLSLFIFISIHSFFKVYFIHIYAIYFCLQSFTADEFGNNEANSAIIS